MSSRFVSGGIQAGDADPAKQPETESLTTQKSQWKPSPIAEQTSKAKEPAETPVVVDKEKERKQREWEVVQKELDDERRKREEARVKAAEGGGERSLFEILEANKGLCWSFSGSLGFILWGFFCCGISSCSNELERLHTRREDVDKLADSRHLPIVV